MGKYKMMLVLPFIIVVMISWLCMGSDNKSAELEKEKNALIEKSQKLEEEKIYYRAAEYLEQAKDIDTGTDSEEIDKKLIYLYKADENYEEWENIIKSRIENGKAKEEEYTELINYYIDDKNYGDALDTLSSAMTAYPENSDFKSNNEKIRGMYSYKECDYSEVGATFGESIAVKSTDGMWGFASSDGGKPKTYDYDEAVSYANGLGLIVSDNKISLINTSGKIYSNCHDSTVDGIFSFDGTSAVLKSGNQYKLADTELETTDKTYDYLGTLSDSMRAYLINGKWGFMNENGDTVISEKYSDVIVNDDYGTFGQGIAFVSDGTGYYMIDKEENKIGSEAFEDAYPFLSGKNQPAAVKLNGKWGFVDTSGNIVIDYSFDEAKSFSSGFAAVMKDGKWGFINSSGNEIIPCEYEEVRPFTGKYAAVKYDGLWDYISLDYYNY